MARAIVSVAVGAGRSIPFRLLPALGDHKVSAITPADCRAYVQTLKGKHLSPATTRHAFTPLRRVLALAQADRAIAHNPTDGVRLPTNASTQRAPRTHFLTAEDVASLAQQMPTPTDALLVTFAAYSGLRAGELAGLDVGDYDPLRAVVHVRRTRTKVKGGWAVGTPKSERSRRTVPIPAWLVADLNDYLASTHPAPTPTTPLFPGRHRYPDLLTAGVHNWDEPWERDAWVKRTFKPALTRVKLDPAIRFHDLRHSFASILFAEGVPLLKISRWMGHSSLAITEQIYTHLNPADDAAELARITRPAPAPSNVRELRA